VLCLLCEVRYDRTLDREDERTSVKPRVSTSGFNPFVMETVELGLIIRMLFFDGAMFKSDNDRYM
jgi:hypothetical protein